MDLMCARWTYLESRRLHLVVSYPLVPHATLDDNKPNDRVIKTMRFKEEHLHNYYSNKIHTFFIIKNTRYYNLYFFCLVFLPLHVSTRVGHLQGAQCQCLAKVIVDYSLLKLR
jgi:hypothetical protein